MVWTGTTSVLPFPSNKTSFASWLRVITHRTALRHVWPVTVHTRSILPTADRPLLPDPHTWHVAVEVMCSGYANPDDRLTSTFDNLFLIRNIRGMRWRRCATSRKVAGSIPDSVIGVFRWHNPSGHTMALRLTQPLTEMSKGGRCVGLTTLPPSCAAEIWEPQTSWDLKACPGM